MPRYAQILGIFCVLVMPAVAAAQASIVGTVVDTSGAVLPGVTVETASPALIEKVRTASATATAGTASRTCALETTR